MSSMKVSELMTASVARCGLHQNLAEAAHVMWESDCGFVPIVDLEEGTLAGVLTDRDTCMAAAIQGRPLAEIGVAEVMTKNVATIRPEDPIEQALDQMASHQLRRLPVVDAGGRLVGVLSANDLFRAVPKSGKQRAAYEHQLVETMASVCEHRHVALARA